jgi:hypothetical protein
MKKQPFFGILPKVLWMVLMSVFLLQCAKPVHVKDGEGCYVLVPIKKSKWEILNFFHKTEYTKVFYNCDELVLDPTIKGGADWQKTLRKKGFTKIDSCNCQQELELWSHTGSQAVDLEGVLKNPPPSADPVGGISFNYVLDFTPPRVGDKRPIQISDSNDTVNYSNLSCGTNKVKVAIVDSGVETINNSNLTRYNWSKVLPFAPNCSTYPATLNFGYNLIQHALEPEDRNGHGTHVNGIAAGISPHDGKDKDFRFPLEFINMNFIEGPTPKGSLFKAVCGLYYSLEQKAQVINISWGYINYNNDEKPRLIEDFLNKAKFENIVVVAAMGNNQTDLDAGNNFWPASFAEYFDNVISVGAVDQAGNRAFFSNWATSKNKMTIAAHGVDIKSAYTNGRYATQSGTSMATPYVTRTAAAIRSIKPSKSASDIKALIVSKSKKGTTGNYRILQHVETINEACK